jgi:hypothetical protein
VEVQTEETLPFELLPSDILFQDLFFERQRVITVKIERRTEDEPKPKAQMLFNKCNYCRNSNSNNMT